MASINRATLLGNVGRDPEIRTLNNGDKVANLSLATSETWKDKNSGERQERTEWHRVTLWGNLAEIVEKYVRKGSRVYIEGQIETRKWTDQSGNDKYSTEIVARGFNGRLLLLDKKPEGDGQAAQAPAPAGGAAPRKAGPIEDDIPFAPCM